MVVKNDIVRTIADGAVRLNLKNYDSDPKRTIRRLIDTGRRLSHSNVQSEMIAFIGSLFHSEHSAYYEAVDTEMQNVDRETLINFGVNLGVSSWKKGVHKLHLAMHLNANELPWILEQDITNENRNDFTEEYCNNLLDNFSKNGIVAFRLNFDKNSILQLPEICKSIRVHPECSFFIVLPDILLKDTLLSALEILKNVLYGVQLNGENSGELAKNLVRHKLLFARIVKLENEDICKQSSVQKELIISLTDLLPKNETSILIIDSEDDADQVSLQRFFTEVLAFRKSCKHPVLLVSYQNDIQKINRIIHGEDVNTNLSSYLPL